MTKGLVFDLARQGDGLIQNGDKKVFIPFVAPQDVVSYHLQSDDRGVLEEIITPSADRVQPACPSFGVCGGCLLQHLNIKTYQAFKVRWLKESLQKLGSFEYDPPVFIPAHTRRRVSFALAWNGQARWFGLNPAKSDKILPIKACLVLVPELEKLIAPLRSFFTDKARTFDKNKGIGDISVLWTKEGADVVITLPFKPDFSWQQAVVELTQISSIVRVSWRQSFNQEPEYLLSTATPTITVSDKTILPFAGSFLQPSQEGQEALIEIVTKYIANSKKIIDLFCGIGTFTIPLMMKKRTLFAIDNQLSSLNALRIASRVSIQTQTRDLFKVPVLIDELEPYDALIFDPPRAGAKEQCLQIAQSNIPTVVAVSCNPISFAKDAEILIQGGYTLQRVTLVDQFVFSTHIELVALFTKPSIKKSPFKTGLF